MADPNPLPSVDSKNELQRESLRGLENALPTDQYVFRVEEKHDFGVDGALEVLIDGRATNLRAQVQLKARSNTTENHDGSVSVSIETSNLNYLLNGTCPIYFLFRPELPELRYALARAEWGRLDQQNPDWRHQDSVVIRFDRVLDADTLVVLKQAIVAESTLHRNLAERTRAVSSVTGALVHVDPVSLEVTDSVRLCAALTEIGIKLAGTGRARTVLDRVKLLPESLLRREPKVRLVQAYAEYQLARYHDAAATVRHVLLDEARLVDEDRSLLRMLFFTVRRMLGDLAEDDYRESMRTWCETAPPHLAAQFRIGEAWDSYSASLRSTGGRGASEAALTELDAAFADARKLGGEQITRQVQLLELVKEAGDLGVDESDVLMMQALASAGVGDAMAARVAHRTLDERKERWMTKVIALADSTSKTDPPGYCELSLLRDFYLLQRERNRMYHVSASEGPPPTLDPDVLEATAETLAVVKTLENAELEARARLQLAEALDTAGDRGRAVEHAQEVYDIAQLMGYEPVARAARRLLEGVDSYAERVRAIQAFANAESDAEVLLLASDEMLSDIAELQCAAMRLPASRSLHILESLRWQKHIAQIQNQWCQDLTMAEHDGHAYSDITKFAGPIPRRVVCTRHRISTAADTNLMTDSFRKEHCTRCGEPRPVSGGRRQKECPAAC